MTALKKYRERCRLTQEQLGEKVGLTGSAINQYESGTRRPNIEILKKLSVVLKCTTDELLEPINV